MHRLSALVLTVSAPLLAPAVLGAEPRRPLRRNSSPVSGRRPPVDPAVVSARVDYGFRLSRSGEPPTYRNYRAISGCE